LKGYEKIQKWIFLTEPFSQENDKLTAKMSLRRNNITKAYTALVDDIFNGLEGFDVSSEKAKVA
jgi:long-subunit acyl-CoA synthetase (AMP-forming)